MDAGVIGGLVGSLIGICGAVIGGYYSIRNTNGPKERKFMVRLTVIVAILVLMLLVVVFSVGNPRANWVMIPFFALVLPALIYFGNKRQRKIRAEESGHQ